MVRPVEDEELLFRLEKVPWGELRPEFRRKAGIVRQKVFMEAPVKAMQGRTLNGEMLATLIEQYVESINKGATPNVTSA
jgi:hypothetical protein